MTVEDGGEEKGSMEQNCRGSPLEEILGFFYAMMIPRAHRLLMNPLLLSVVGRTLQTMVVVASVPVLLILLGIDVLNYSWIIIRSYMRRNHMDVKRLGHRSPCISLVQHDIFLLLLVAVRMIQSSTFKKHRRGVICTVVPPSGGVRNKIKGTNDGMGLRLWHLVALKSNMGAGAANLTNEGVEILAPAIDSSLTGGVATSANQYLRLLLDSGASSHVVGDRNILQGYRELANPRLGIVADGNNVSIIGVGTIQTGHFTITDVYHVEGFPMNLISVSQLYRQYGMSFWFFRGRCRIMLDDGSTVGDGILENDRLYVLTNLHVPAGPVQG